VESEHEVSQWTTRDRSLVGKRRPRREISLVNLDVMSLQLAMRADL
jgi:hypothetical protein